MSFLNKRSLLSAFFLAIIIGSIAYYRLRSPEQTAVERGRKLASQYGCFACHGFEGSKGISNPGYTFGDIPAWQGGTAMMYIKNDSDIREYILYGKPKRKKERAKGLIKMPAFKGVINEQELSDLVAYLKAVMEIIEIKDSAAVAGFDIAEKNGCFGCHGPYGKGGMTNPFALKGYIPGWDGEDFTELVRNDDELLHWIEEGEINRLKNNPVASFFTRRQIIKMPAYEDILSTKEIRALVQYIKWLRKNTNAS